MKYFLNGTIAESEKEKYRKELVHDNIHRGKILAFVLIGFELVLALADICTSILKVDSRFHFNGYLVMYLIMIGINILYLLSIGRFEKLNTISIRQLKKMEIRIIVYITLIMSWGSVVSLMDQKLYGQLMVFMVMMITTSVMYFLESKKILIPYAFSVLIITIGLPFFQSSKDILIGHYVNLCIFIITSWLASRIIFFSYINDFNNRNLLQKANELLEKEIKENRDINNKLALANLQLKKMALIDELTGIPNRRGFRNYIDIAFDSYGETKPLLSILMIDIDYFKQFNDNYGHETGDKVLIAVTRQIDLIEKSTEKYFCRWGGEEFVFSVFNSSREDAIKLAETIRNNVCQLKISHEFSQADENLSVSIGIGTMESAGKDDVSKVINLADQALYLAKNNGRNRIESFSAD